MNARDAYNLNKGHIIVEFCECYYVSCFMTLAFCQMNFDVDCDILQQTNKTAKQIHDCHNYRGIMLLSVPGKVFARPPSQGEESLTRP